MLADLTGPVEFFLAAQWRPSQYPISQAGAADVGKVIRISTTWENPPFAPAKVNLSFSPVTRRLSLGHFFILYGNPNLLHRTVLGDCWTGFSTAPTQSSLDGPNPTVSRSTLAQTVKSVWSRVLTAWERRLRHAAPGAEFNTP